MSNKAWAAIIASVAFIIILVVVLMYAIPKYRVWQQELAGQAALMRASQERKIQIEQAQAELEAAKLRAQSIEIMGEAAAAYPEYRAQEFMAAFGEALQNNPNLQLIYIPTEANIPITEAFRFANRE